MATNPEIDPKFLDGALEVSRESTEPAVTQPRDLGRPLIDVVSISKTLDYLDETLD